MLLSCSKSRLDFSLLWVHIGVAVLLYLCWPCVCTAMTTYEFLEQRELLAGDSIGGRVDSRFPDLWFYTLIEKSPVSPIFFVLFQEFVGIYKMGYKQASL